MYKPTAGNSKVVLKYSQKELTKTKWLCISQFDYFFKCSLECELLFTCKEIWMFSDFVLL